MKLGTVLPDQTRKDVERRLQRGGIDFGGFVFRLALVSCLVFALLVLLVLVADVFDRGFGVLTDRGLDFLSAPLRTRADEAGIFQSLRGTFWIGVFVVALAFPFGIGAAIYLEEYAPDNRLTRLIDVNIRNLAGVPSVVYGILGFSIFVKAADGFFPGSVGDHAGKTTAAAGVTLAVLVLPIVIITSAEAIRAVPREIREASYGVGATQWDTIRTNVLPYAAPGILTGTLLSLARALGEAAPLILVGAVQGRLGSRTGFFEPEQLSEQFTAMPITITDWATKPANSGFVENTAAAIIVLLVVVLLANAVAILLRNRFENKRAGR
ncbi:MAG: phosphate ABC transporter permease PstA [Acidimicrobiia bacterium]|nr:phosphate ABC transporter permease PstA [Acidimicrobiia bacterium]